MVDWFNAIRAARFHYLQVAFPGAPDSEVSMHEISVNVKFLSALPEVSWSHFEWSWVSSAFLSRILFTTFIDTISKCSQGVEGVQSGDPKITPLFFLMTCFSAHTGAAHSQVEGSRNKNQHLHISYLWWIWVGMQLRMGVASGGGVYVSLALAHELGISGAGDWWACCGKERAELKGKGLCLPVETQSSPHLRSRTVAND